MVELRPETDLRLLSGRLSQLAETPYFSPRLHSFTDALVAAIGLALDEKPAPPILRGIADSVAVSYEYLAGSTSREAPHEIKYALETILPEWVSRPVLITTSLQTSRVGFHFLPNDPWSTISTLLPSAAILKFDPILILMGLPRLYQHKPIFCGPLYHELGHFVDIHLNVSQLSMLMYPPPPTADANTRKIILHWRMEHFADLFSASYIGESSILALEEIAPGAGASATHPATALRGQIVREYLSGTSNQTVDMFNNILGKIKAPLLKIRYEDPDIASSFDDLRPHHIESPAQLHGLFNASWTYLAKALDTRVMPWSTRPLDHGGIEKVVNDLTEKSLRNYFIRMRWDSVTANSR